jgi:hypothetical protein
MYKEPVNVDIGFSEFRSRIYQKYPVAFEKCKELVHVANEFWNKPVSSPYPHLIGRICCIVCNSLGGLVILVLNGYGNDAVKIARGMFEAAVTVGYLKRHPEPFQDYWDFHWIRHKRSYELMVKLAPQHARKISEDKIAETERNYAAVVDRFRNKDKKVRRRWSKVSFREMTEEVGMGELYSTFYNWASSMIHLDIGGISLQVERETMEVDLAPSERWLEEALVIGHGSAVKVLTDYNEMAKLGLEKEVQIVNTGFETAWRKVI